MAEPDPIVAGRIVPPRSRVRIGLGASVVLLLVGLAAAVLVSTFGAAGATRVILPDASTSASPGVDAAAASPDAVDPQATGPPAVFVHMLGAVARPGLYELHDGDRVVDAVAAAAGFTESADQRSVNLARRVVDGEQIYVPVIGEIPPPTASSGSSSGSPSGDPGAAGQPVNLNTADEAALDTLPGVGPATAASIISWRDENGGFTSVEDLMSVDGIGDKTFEALKDLVTV